MLGRNVQATPTLVERRARLNLGLALRTRHGMKIPMTPAMTVSVMYPADSRKILPQESECDCGGWQIRMATTFAKTRPVRMRARVCAT